MRTLTNASGVEIEAEVLELTEGVLKIRAKGRVFELPVETLSSEDQEWAAKWAAQQEGEAESSYYEELVFEDDFSGDAFDERWVHYKSGSVIQDGVFAGITPVDSDHQAVDTIKFEGRQDVEVSMKFKFSGPDGPRFALKFDDNQYKGSHAGHICRVTISRADVTLSDGKTGSFANEIYDMKNSADGLSEEVKALLATKVAKFPMDLDNDDWHELLLRTKGDRMTVEVDGEALGELVSEGVAHATKSVVGMATPGNGLLFDDFVVKAAPSSD